MALAAYCQCVGRYLAADSWITKNGTVATIRNDKGEVKSSFIAPQLTVSLKLLEKILAYQKEFGLSPAARQKFDGSGADDEPMSAEEEFFGRGGGRIVG